MQNFKGRNFTVPLPLGPGLTIFCLSLTLLFCLSVALTAHESVESPAEQIVRRVIQVQQNRLPTYTVLRRYVLRNRAWNQEVIMQVRMTDSVGEGKKFDILSMQGGSKPFRRALRRVIEGEAEASRPAVSDQMRLSQANYTFTLLGEETIAGERCHVLRLEPRRNNKYLVHGRVWVSASDFGLVRLEGRPAANVSFWVGTPSITQEFRQVQGHWLADRSSWTANARFVGQTELVTECDQYQILPLKTSERAGGMR